MVLFLLFVAVLGVLVICRYCYHHCYCCCCYHFCSCCHSCLALLGREFIGLQKGEGPHFSCNTSNQHTTKDTKNKRRTKYQTHQIIKTIFTKQTQENTQNMTTWLTNIPLLTNSSKATEQELRKKSGRWNQTLIERREKE